MNLIVPMVLAAGAGVSVVIQQVVNANLRTAINSAAWAGVASYFVGLIAMALFVLLIRDPLPSTSLMARVPWWPWSGGFFGAILSDYQSCLYRNSDQPLSSPY